MAAFLAFSFGHVKSYMQADCIQILRVRAGYCYKKGRVFIQFVKVTSGDMRGEKNPAVMYELLIKDLIR